MAGVIPPLRLRIAVSGEVARKRHFVMFSSVAERLRFLADNVGERREHILRGPARIAYESLKNPPVVHSQKTPLSDIPIFYIVGSEKSDSSGAIFWDYVPERRSRY